MAAKTVKFTTKSNIDLTDVTVNSGAAATATPRPGGFVLRNRVNAADLSAANKLMWTIDDATFTDDDVTNFRILEVPERVYVRNLFIAGIKDATPPAVRITGAKASNASITASDLDAMALTWNVDQNKKPTSHASYAAASHLVSLTTVNAEALDGATVVAGEAFGRMLGKVVASDAAWSSNANWVLLDTFKAIDSSIASPLEPMQAAKKMVVSDGTSISDPIGHYFPYGGFVTMRLGPFNTSLSSSVASGKDVGLYSSTTAATPDLAGVWEFQAQCQYVPE
jgi:hypothetical protein